jgi:hypothetical protein
MMSRLAFIAVVFGAMLFVLALMPNVIATFMDELQNLRGDFSPTSGPLHGTQTDSVQVWLLVCGAVMMIPGLFGLLTN